MSHNFDTEELIRELISLDSGFEAHGRDFRVLIRELREKRPIITPDPAFVTSLRARILLKNHSVQSSFSNLSTWALRLAPIGMVALLLLILTPQGLFYDTTDVDKDTVIREIMEDPQVLRVETGDAPVSSGYFGMGGGGGGEGVDSSVSMKSASAPLADALPPAPTILTEAKPGTSITIESVRVEAPSFIAVFLVLPTGEDNLVGTSELIAPLSASRVSVPLRERSSVGQQYRAALYADNGDGVFTMALDTLERDAYGGSASIVFEIVGDEQ